MSRALPLSKGIQVSVLAAILLIVALAGAVWACTPRPQNFALDPPVAAVGEEPTKVTATGTVADGGVQLHWDGVNGPVLNEATPKPGADGHFSTTFEVPEDAEPGVHYVVAHAGDGVARAALQVTGDGEPAEAASTSAWQAGPTEATADPVETNASGLSTPTMAGMGMLALGGAGLFASFTTVAVQRRRVPAQRVG